MKITALTTFKDGTDTFVKDDIRTVDDERGARFVAAGWAKDNADGVAVAAAEGETTLDIQNVTHKQSQTTGA